MLFFGHKIVKINLNHQNWLPCIIKHGVDFQFVNGIAANTRHRVTVIIKQSKARRVGTTCVISSGALHFFNWIKITGHHFLFDHWCCAFHWTVTVVMIDNCSVIDCFRVITILFKFKTQFSPCLLFLFTFSSCVFLLLSFI